MPRGVYERTAEIEEEATPTEAQEAPTVGVGVVEDRWAMLQEALEDAYEALKVWERRGGVVIQAAQQDKKDAITALASLRAEHWVLVEALERIAEEDIFGVPEFKALARTALHPQVKDPA